MSKSRRAACCIVTTMANEYAALCQTYQTLDAAEHTDESKLKMAHIEDKREAIRLAASFHVPKTSTGAAFVLAQAFSTGDGLASCDYVAGIKEDMERRLTRYHFNLLRYLKEQGAALDDSVTDESMPTHMDPLP